MPDFTEDSWILYLLLCSIKDNLVWLKTINKTYSHTRALGKAESFFKAFTDNIICFLWYNLKTWQVVQSLYLFSFSLKCRERDEWRDNFFHMASQSQDLRAQCWCPSAVAGTQVPEPPSAALHISRKLDQKQQSCDLNQALPNTDTATVPAPGGVYLKVLQSKIENYTNSLFCTQTGSC